MIAFEVKAVLARVAGSDPFTQSALLTVFRGAPATLDVPTLVALLKVTHADWTPDLVYNEAFRLKGI